MCWQPAGALTVRPAAALTQRPSVACQQKGRCQSSPQALEDTVQPLRWGGCLSGAARHTIVCGRFQGHRAGCPRPTLLSRHCDEVAARIWQQAMAPHGNQPSLQVEGRLSHALLPEQLTVEGVLPGAGSGCGGCQVGTALLEGQATVSSWLGRHPNSPMSPTRLHTLHATPNPDKAETCLPQLSAEAALGNSHAIAPQLRSLKGCPCCARRLVRR